MVSNKGQEILDSRAATYGDRKTNMAAMAKIVNGYLDGVQVRNGTGQIEGQDFAMIMLLYKAYRFAVTPDYADNINDIDGYAKMAREFLGDDLIEAATAEQYQRIKQGPQVSRAELDKTSLQNPYANIEDDEDEPQPTLKYCDVCCKWYASPDQYKSGALWIVKPEMCEHPRHDWKVSS